LGAFLLKKRAQRGFDALSYFGADLDYWFQSTAEIKKAGGDPATLQDDKLDQWLDQSGNDRTLSQAVDARRPTLNLAARMNGIQTINFDGVDDLMTCVHPTGDPGFVIIVYRLNSLVSIRDLLTVSQGAVVNRNLICRAWNSVAIPNHLIAQINTDTYDIIHGDTVITTATDYLSIWSSTNGTSYDMWVNDVLQGKTIFNGADTGDWLDDVGNKDVMSVGASLVGGGGPSNEAAMDATEIIGVNRRTLSTLDRATVTDYVADKYAITMG